MAKKLIEVVEGDYRYQDYETEAQKWLLKIEALKRRTPEGEKVSFEAIEQLIIKLQKKYGHTMQWISLTLIDGELPWYSVSIRDGDTKEWVKTIYGLTMYELYCKVALFLFAYTRKKDKHG
jgi:hypothetical protein